MSFAGVLIALLLFAMCWVPRNPNQCNFWGAIAGAVVGGLFSRKNNKATSAAHANDSYMNSPAGWRAEGEANGFNPLFVAGKQLGAGYSPTFENEGIHLGRAVEAGITALDQKKLQLTQLKKQNNRLTQQMRRTTFDAKSPSVYERRNSNVGQVARPDAGNMDRVGDVSRSDALRTSRLNGDGVATAYSDRVTAPAATAFGVDFHGSGAFSSGETIEDAIGDNPLSLVAAPAIVGDMIGHTFGNYRSGFQQSKADAAMDEWFRRAREKDPINPKRPRSRPQGRIMSPSLSGGDANGFYQSLFN